MSGTLMFCLFVFYVAIGGVAMYEKKYPVALYWGSAALITLSVMWMNK